MRKPNFNQRSSLATASSTPENRMRPAHSGEVLREDDLKPLDMNVYAIAIPLNVPASRINDIVAERRGVIVDTAMRFVRFFGSDVQNWMNVQTAYDNKVAQQLIAKKLLLEVQPMAA